MKTANDSLGTPSPMAAHAAQGGASAQEPMPAPARRQPWAGVLLFISIAILEALLCAYLAWEMRIPSGHDGFQYVSMQYYFLNNSAATGEIAQWMPFMTQGTVATWWYTVQASIFQNAIFPVARLLAGQNLLPYIYVGFFVDGLVLLTGTWLLSRRFFDSPWTAAFVSICALGGALWIDQPWHNFHFYHAIPLVLALAHRFLDTGRWLWFALAGNLLAMQTLGNMPYAVPVTSLLIFCYLGSYAILNRGYVWSRLRAMRLNWKAAAAVGVVVVSFGAYFFALLPGTGQIVNYNIGREDGAAVSLENFLTHGGNVGMSKWIETLTGLCPSRNYTLYSGIFLLPLAAYGVLKTSRREAHFLIVAIAALLLSLASPLATAAYYVWPGMSYFRHLELIAPWVRLLACFLAGVGFERLFISSGDEAGSPASAATSRQGGPALRLVPLLPGICMVIVSGALFAMAMRPQWGRYFVEGMTTGRLEMFNIAMLHDSVINTRLTASAGFALAAAVVMLAAVAAARSPRARRLVIFAAVGVAAVDAYLFKLTHTLIDSDSIAQHPDLLVAQPMPYVPKRHLALRRDHARARQLLEVSQIANSWYWSTHSFLFHDQVGQAFRTDHWLRPLDQFMKAYWGQPIDAAAPPRGWIQYRQLYFPLQHPAAPRFAAVTRNKIQFYRGAHMADSELRAARWMTSADYEGMSPILLGPDAPHDSHQLDDAPPPELSAVMYTKVEHEVTDFDANRLVVHVNNDTGGPLCMVYSDVWHPQWRAKVDGEPVTVYRANLAYKAVKVPPGKHRVVFRFSYPGMVAVTWFASVNSIVWIAVLIALCRGVLRGGEQAHGRDPDSPALR